MSKTALLFAGQGAQVVGMGKDWPRSSLAQRIGLSEATRFWVMIWQKSVLKGQKVN